MNEIITPLLTQLGVGGIAGLCVGFALKKMGKLAAFILGLSFLGLEYLAYEGIISINYNALELLVRSFIGNVGGFEVYLTAIISNLPFAVSFGVGFALGLKSG
jgi:uncharacterized membrane protein (Fun14 family)